MSVSHRFVVIVAIFVTCFLTGNIVGVKMFSLGSTSIILPAAVILFPLSYIIGDILTEVYGYRRARRVIWLGFLSNLIFVVIASIGQILPPAPNWEWQQAYETILGYTPRLFIASVSGYLVGEFSNSFIMAKMKILTQGRRLWTRTIGSTIVGEGLDTVIFLTVAYYGVPFFVPTIILYHWLAKVIIESAATPLTYAVVNYLKKRESVDTFDHQTNFNPFLVSEK